MRRVPGGKVRELHSDPRMLATIPEPAEWYNLIFIWLGSNDIRDVTNPSNVLRPLIQLVESLRPNCETIRVIKIEPRNFSRRGICTRGQELYDKGRKSINRRLVRVKGVTLMDFGSKFFKENIGKDGVHFNTIAKAEIVARLTRAIWEESRDYRSLGFIRDPQTE